MGTEIRLAGLTIAVVPADGVPCYLEPGQAQIALAWLLLERDRGTTRDGLADVVWPNQLPRTWGSALRSLVSRLRAFLATTLALPSSAQPVVAQGGRYLVRLPEDVVIDVEAAARSVAAAQEALAAGDPATAVRLATAGADCLRCPFLPAHDGPWVAARRDHLSELLLAGLETGSQAALQLRDPTRALMLAEEAATLAPLRESAHRCRMAAHAASGNRGEALRAYQDIRRLLAEELGVDPAPDTEAAYLDLLGVPSSSTVAATAEADGRAPAEPRLVAPFVDRTGEMAVISEAWGRAGQARRQLLYITGEAGVGKTRLMKEAGRRIAVDGGLVLFGRSDRDSPIAYQPFVEALDGYVAAIPADELATLSPLAQRELAALFPAADGTQSASDRRAGPGSENLADVFGAVTELVAHTSRRRPTLLLFDDLHWANRDTLVFLRHLLRHTDESRLLVIGTARDDIEHGRPLVEVTYGLEREGLLSRLPLGGLDTDALGELVEHVRPDLATSEALVRRLHAATAGNPVMSLELLGQPELPDLREGAGHRRLPQGIHDLVDAKLAVTPRAEVERLLHAAALVGSVFELGVAAGAAQLELPLALDALDASLLVGLVVEVDPERAYVEGVSEYRFRHEAVRWSLASRLSGARRNHLLRRVAEATGARELAASPR
ncbi:MAG TPA: BTAD domain-containing putative transcriptional regulator [Acidimicrobiales bacterium]|nr:BTAD domain-containing putative transcriptional regulator [Acidimicrobiales bacterium]